MEYQIPIRAANHDPPHSGQVTGMSADQQPSMTFQIPLRPARVLTALQDEHMTPPTDQITSEDSPEDVVVERLAVPHALLMENSTWYKSAWRKMKARKEKRIEVDSNLEFSFDTWRLLFKWLRTGRLVPSAPASDILSFYSDSDENTNGPDEEDDDTYEPNGATYSAYDSDDNIDYEYREGRIAQEVLTDQFMEYLKNKNDPSPRNEDDAEAFIIERHFPDSGLRRASQLDEYQLSVLIKLLLHSEYATNYPKGFIHLLAEVLQIKLASSALQNGDYQNLAATATDANDEFSQLIDLANLADRLQTVKPLRSAILKRFNLHHVWRVACGCGYLPSAEDANKVFEKLGMGSRICRSVVAMYAREWRHADRSLPEVKASGRFVGEFLREVVEILEAFDEVDDDVGEDGDEMDIDG